MTRKHFETIAAILATNNATPAMIAAFATMFQADNPNFDRARFIAAATR